MVLSDRWRNKKLYRLDKRAQSTEYWEDKYHKKLLEENNLNIYKPWIQATKIRGKKLQKSFSSLKSDFL